MFVNIIVYYKSINDTALAPENEFDITIWGSGHLIGAFYFASITQIFSQMKDFHTKFKLLAVFAESILTNYQFLSMNESFEFTEAIKLHICKQTSIYFEWSWWVDLEDMRTMNFDVYGRIRCYQSWILIFLQNLISTLKRLHLQLSFVFFYWT